MTTAGSRSLLLSSTPQLMTHQFTTVIILHHTKLMVMLEMPDGHYPVANFNIDFCVFLWWVFIMKSLSATWNESEWKFTQRFTAGAANRVTLFTELHCKRKKKRRFAISSSSNGRWWNYRSSNSQKTEKETCWQRQQRAVLQVGLYAPVCSTLTSTFYSVAYQDFLWCYGTSHGTPVSSPVLSIPECLLRFMTFKLWEHYVRLASFLSHGLRYALFSWTWNVTLTLTYELQQCWISRKKQRNKKQTVMLVWLQKGTKRLWTRAESDDDTALWQSSAHSQIQRQKTKSSLFNKLIL